MANHNHTVVRPRKHGDPLPQPLDVLEGQIAYPPPSSMSFAPLSSNRSNKETTPALRCFHGGDPRNEEAFSGSCGITERSSGCHDLLLDARL